MNIGIVGLGLIGGSMARSIKTKTLHSVLGIDLDEETMMFARMCGAIDERLDDDRIAECDLLLLAICPQAAVNWVKINAEKISPRTVVIDLCGVKRIVCSELSDVARSRGFSYIGGHPMAGSERGGFVNSTPTLFDGASMILTPDEKTDIRMLEMLKAFFTDIGFASLTFSTPEEHDMIIAYTSQLAHVVSNAYVKSPEAMRRRGFSAGSFRDLTRVARLDEKMWTELFLGNADYLTQQLDILMDNLEQYRTALRARDAAALETLLRDGREKKAMAGGN